MRLAAIDRMTPSMPDFANLYVTIEQLPARRTTGILLGTLMLFAAALLSPFYMIATTALADQALRDAVSTRPIRIATNSHWARLLARSARFSDLSPAQHVDPQPHHCDC